MTDENDRIVQLVRRLEILIERQESFNEEINSCGNKPLLTFIEKK